MATDLERLVLQIEANTRGLERSLKRVERSVDGTMTRASRSTRVFDAAMGRAAASAGALAAAFVGSQALRGAQQLVDSATRIENALKVAGLSGVGLTQVYDALYASAQKNAAPLETLVQLYSRAATVQNELGVTTQELLGFTDKVALALRVAGTDAQTASGALLQLSQALGSGVVRAEEFNSILEGALPIAQAAAVGLEEAGGSVARLRQLVIDGQVSSEAFFRAFEAGSAMLEDRVASAEMTVSQQFVRLQNVLIDTAGKFDDTIGISDSLGGALDELAGIVQGLGNVMVEVADSDFVHFANMLATPIRLIDEFKEKIGGLRNLPAFLGAVHGVVQDRLRGITPEERRAQSRVERAFEVGETTETTKRLPRLEIGDTRKYPTVSLADYAAPAGGGGGRSGRGGGRSSAASEAERQAKAIDRVIESLKFEHEQLGRTDDEQRLYNELKRAGVDISSEAGQQIAGLVTQIEQEEQAMRRAAEASEFFSDLTYDAFRSIVPAIETGNQALDRLINSLIEAAGQAVILGEGPLAGLLGGKPSSRGSGGGFGGILGGLFGGFFADGGQLGSGKWGIAGENGPEIIHGPANVTPMHEIGRSSQQAVHVTVGVATDGNGNLMPFVQSVSQQEAAKVTQAGLRQFDDRLNRTWASRTNQAQARQA